ncbi:MAG: HlyD family efflux transporter periplasmic adaptor subunit [Patescibacteria group bacterium]|nr:HlyD family efflux transporter periplasmic adaptor subunit [Patescibacteria group bacterium]MDD5164398.1 HlyD family efflux transporter periplasmic adaptor subunit [Patescibacteria group bacterium]MDD5534950.1 HlyD family efflux transporter periplasmic adaptor subunit [Patescibacteria group bacterium]
MKKKITSKQKFIIALIIILIAGGSYFVYKKNKSNTTEIRYTLTKVEKGTLITSVSGSGQISASNQVDIKAKASGDVVYLGVKLGQEVKSGTSLVRLDPSDAQINVRNAETALETAKLQLEDLLAPADKLTMLQAENSLVQAKDSLTKLKFTQATNYQNALDAKQNAKDDLQKAYEDGFNNVSNTFLELPNIITGLQDLLFGFNFSTTQYNLDYYTSISQLYDEKATQYRDDTYTKYQSARTAYDKNFLDYKSADRSSDKIVIESLISETYETTRSIAEALKSVTNLIQFYKDKLTERSLRPQTLADTHLSTLSTYTGKTNTYLLNLLSIKSTLQTDKDTIIDKERDLKEMDQNYPLDLTASEESIKEKEQKLADLKAGATDLDIRNQKITIQQKQDALTSAKQTLADYYIQAPFDGVVAELNVKNGDSISSGASVITFITKQKMAEVTLNEVDIAKVKIGQKVTITFDAIEDLSISGEVIETDAIGTVSQGVVTYNVKIGFDTQDERVKSGMSMSATIITDVKQDVLLIPNSAVKTLGDTSYVEIFDSTINPKNSTTNTATVIVKNSPAQQSIQTGLINDSSTEIISGLKEGDWVVSGTSSSSSATQTKTTNTRNLFQMGGGGPRD